VYLEPFSGHEDKFVSAVAEYRRKMSYPDSMRILVVKDKTMLDQFRLLLINECFRYVSIHSEFLYKLCNLSYSSLKLSTAVKEIYSNNKISIY
jgi:hypothetical protein